MPSTLAKVRFFGPESADLFSLEVEASFQGVLTKNFVSDPADPNAGFVFASIDGRPWSDTMWTRDAGTFLRELALWGNLQDACLLAERLMDLVRPNSEGFSTFPEYFKPGQPGSGSEMDGTSAIVIGLVLLWERLEADVPARRRIADFLHGLASPLAYMLYRLEQRPLIPGSGEFGGGVATPGEWANVVQNNLVRLALLAAARMQSSSDPQLSRRYAQAAQTLSDAMLHYLRDDQGCWIWCVDPVTLKPDPAILNHPLNQGFGGINGVLSMSADVGGLAPLESGWEGISASLKTFDRLFSEPNRRLLFERHGAWTQFDRFCNGCTTGPSYGHGYATQAMLLIDRLDLADRALQFLAQATFRPLPGNVLDRESPYYFPERFYLPELLALPPGGIQDFGWTVFDGEKFDQGCGALNLVCVAEPLKIARLIVGVDDHDPSRLRVIPRLPASWSGYQAENWPVNTPAGLQRVDLDCRRDGARVVVRGLRFNAGL